MEQAARVAGSLSLKLLTAAYVEARDGTGITVRERELIASAVQRLRSDTDIKVPSKVIDGHLAIEKKLARQAGKRGGAVELDEGEIVSTISVRTKRAQVPSRGSASSGGSEALVPFGPFNIPATEQEISSARTSRKQIPSVFRWLVDNAALPKGSVNADLGGGKYDDGTEYFGAYGVNNLVWDPFNRSEAHNQGVLERLAKKPAESATIANVLNVIKEPEERDKVIALAARTIVPDGTAYFQVWEKNRDGVGRATRDGWQNSRKAEAYADEVRAHFGSVEVKRLSADSGVLIARYPGGTSALLDRAAKLGAGRRSTRLDPEAPVGKTMGNQTWIHRSYERVLPRGSLAKAKKKLPAGFEYEVVRYDNKSGDIAFIASADFDTATEPTVGESIKITPDGKVTRTLPPADPWIWHHKWMFVRDDYTGFDVTDSILRSIAWKSVVGKNKKLSSRIGKKSVWDSEVLPKLPTG